MFNLVVLTGRLTSDPELKTTQSNVSVTSFCIAVQRRYKSGEEPITDFINIVAWRNTAEFVAKYFKKGNMIGIEGSIQTRKYTDKDGNNRVVFEVLASNVSRASAGILMLTLQTTQRTRSEPFRRICRMPDLNRRICPMMIYLFSEV